MYEINVCDRCLIGVGALVDRSYLVSFERISSLLSLPPYPLHVESLCIMLRLREGTRAACANTRCWFAK